MDYEKWYDSCKFLLNLGFDLDRNTASDLLAAINEVYENYEEYINPSQES